MLVKGATGIILIFQNYQNIAVYVLNMTLCLASVSFLFTERKDEVRKYEIYCIYITWIIFKMLYK